MRTHSENFPFAL